MTGKCLLNSVCYRLIPVKYHICVQEILCLVVSEMEPIVFGFVLASFSQSGSNLGTNHYFFARGLPCLGLADNFFPKNNAFQTIFFITYCNENNFLRPF